MHRYEENEEAYEQDFLSLKESLDLRKKCPALTLSQKA
jgi:hypothetical protein